MPYRTIQFPVKSEPVLTPTQRPEAVTADRWAQPFGTPVRRAGLIAAAIVASGMVNAPFTPEPFSETITVDKWQRPFSEPTRIKGLPAGEQQATAGPVRTAPFTDTTPDRWIALFHEPVRLKRGLSTGAQQHLALVEAHPFADTTADQWAQPFVYPTRLVPRLATGSQQALAFVLSFPIADTAADRWFKALSEPVRFRTLATAQQMAVVWSAKVPAADTDTGRWYVPLAEPVRFRTLATAHQRALTWPEKFPVADTAAEWFAALAEPVRTRQALAAAEQVAQPFVAPQVIAGWQPPLSEPVRFRTLATAQEQAIVWSPKVPAADTAPDRWYAAFSEPVRFRNLPPHQQQATAYVRFALPTIEIVTADKWHAALTEPVRTRPGLSANAQQALVLVLAAPFADTTVDRWGQPLSLPRWSRNLPIGQYQAALASPLPVVAGPASWQQAWPDPRRTVRLSLGGLVDGVTVEISLASWWTPLSEPWRALRRSYSVEFRAQHLAPQTGVGTGGVDSWFSAWLGPVARPWFAGNGGSALFFPPASRLERPPRPSFDATVETGRRDRTIADARDTSITTPRRRDRSVVD